MELFKKFLEANPPEMPADFSHKDYKRVIGYARSAFITGYNTGENDVCRERDTDAPIVRQKGTRMAANPTGDGKENSWAQARHEAPKLEGEGGGEEALPSRRRNEAKVQSEGAGILERKA